MKLLKRSLFGAALMLLSVFSMVGQTKSDYQGGSFGLGVGMEYGGLGVQGSVPINKVVKPFIGIGYNFDLVGWCIGSKIVLSPNKPVTTYFKGLYGYDMALVLSNVPDKKDLFEGFAIGFGFEVHPVKRKKISSFWDFGIMILAKNAAEEYSYETHEFKNGEVITYTEVHKNEPSVPFAFSVGYHFGAK